MKMLIALILGVLAVAAPPAIQYAFETPNAEKTSPEQPTADEVEEAYRYLGGVFRTKEPVQALPKHIPSEHGQVSVYADYEHADSDGVPLYVVNRSPQPLRLANQDGNIYLKLQFCNEKGGWQRAEPHAMSDCGNSDGLTVVEPGTFLRTRGHKADRGRMMPVRYRFYNQSVEMASNVGELRVDEREVELAGRDAMAPYEWPLDLIERVALGKDIVVNEVDHIDLRKEAIHALAQNRFPQGDRVRILKALRNKREKTYSDLAVRFLDDLKRRE
jgi:hypothetical protein